jgi:Flp pilus assembly protein TadB
MSSDFAWSASLASFAALIALPALAAAVRRRALCEASDVANALGEFASSLRRRAACLPMDSSLRNRAQRLKAPEFTSLVVAEELPQSSPELLADTAQRLALRLKRRVAFERKMLARTASGRRRGAVAASLPPAVLMAMHVLGVPLPSSALWLVLALEACGCWFLWRVARVEI